MGFPELTLIPMNDRFNFVWWRNLHHGYEINKKNKSIYATTSGLLSLNSSVIVSWVRYW
jgi:hypothetical protein